MFLNIVTTGDSCLRRFTVEVNNMHFRAGWADRSFAMRGRAHATQVGSSLTYSYKGHRWTNDVKWWYKEEKRMR